MTKAETSPHATYVAHLEKGELAYQWSPDAGRAVFYPRLVCPYSGSTRLEWRVASGLGTVYSTTTVHPVKGEPFNVALIDCDEGFRLMSRVEDVNSDEVAVGTRVTFRVHRPGGEEEPQPVFVPAGAETKPAAAVSTIASRPLAKRGQTSTARRGSAAIVGVAESDLGQVAEDIKVFEVNRTVEQLSLDELLDLSEQHVEATHKPQVAHDGACKIADDVLVVRRER